MNQYLWINRWNDIRKKSAITKQKEGLTFLSIYTMEDFKRVLSELYMGLQMNEGSMTSRYVCFIPPNGNEVIKLRLSDHPSSPSEWGEKEITGLPNRRYSIVLFSKKSMPIETKQGIKELDWKSYSAQNIPTYEKTFNRYYLRETFDTLKSILATIYQGGSPEDNTIPINLAENKTRNNMNKKLIRLTESDLHRIVKESVSKILKESNDFKPTGYRTVSNLGGHEVQIHPSGDSARFKFYGGEPTDWLEIEFNEDGVAYVETERGRELLSDYMRY